MLSRRLMIGCIAGLSACTTGQSVSSLREGMTEQEVRDVLGAPDGFLRDGEFSAFQYRNRLMSGWSWDRADYGFIFQQGRLAQWGAGNVRPDQTRRGVLIIVR